MAKENETGTPEQGRSETVSMKRSTVRTIGWIAGGALALGATFAAGAVAGHVFDRGPGGHDFAQGHDAGGFGAPDGDGQNGFGHGDADGDNGQGGQFQAPQGPGTMQAPAPQGGQQAPSAPAPQSTP